MRIFVITAKIYSEITTFRRDFWTSIVLCILTMLTSPALAAGYEVSDFTFSHLGLTDGLNSPRIHSLRQTDDGAVWITTKNNVARYNGVSIENFEIKVPGMRNIEECNPHFVQSDENQPALPVRHRLINTG